MGLDAPSTDLTARIQRKRRELLAEGLVEPARPGEQVVFRGGPVAAPAARTMVPPPSNPRVVPLDETPERGGTAALAESEVTASEEGVGVEDTQTEVGTPVPADVTGDGPTPGPFVNEFGETYDENDDGGFDLGDEPRDAEGLPDAGHAPPEFVQRGLFTLAQDDLILIPDEMRPKSRKRKSGPTAADRHAELLRWIESLDFRLENIEKYLKQEDLRSQETYLRSARLEKSLEEIDQGLMVIAEFLAKQQTWTQDLSKIPDKMYSGVPEPGDYDYGAEIPEPEIPSFVRKPRGRIARFFLGN